MRTLKTIENQIISVNQQMFELLNVLSAQGVIAVTIGNDKVVLSENF